MMTREFVIDGRRVNDDEDCYVVAEIGHNHQGELEKAKQLFHRAKECGVDAVKLQKRDNRTLYTEVMYNGPYEHENSFGRTYGEHREFLEFGMDEYRELKRYAQELGVTFFATVFDFPSADFLAKLEVPAFKIASGDLRNIPLIKYVARFQKPMFISTGGSTMDDVQRAYDALKPINSQFCFLHSTMAYPTPPDEMNLLAVAKLRERFPDVVIGLSDHYNGIAMAVVAYVLGARVIEKHFTLNHTWKGTDHAMSLEPIGLQKMVRDLRRARIALGDGLKRVYPSEANAMLKMGKKLVATGDIPAGHRLTEADIAIKSPGDGLPPYELERMVGKLTRRSLSKDDSITFEILEGSIN
jgi:N-acetylneuraminate synthase/sialic acid synthase